jgi:riboflavin synthase alpha subunit
MDVLRKEIFHEFGMVQGELHLIQRQLKETRECATTRDEEIHLEIDVLGRYARHEHQLL